MHTTLSDGSDTFEEVLRQAIRRDIRRVAFTNHDTTCGLDEARAAGERLGVEVVGGIEVSAYDFARGRKVHVLGFGLGEHAPALAALCGPVLDGAGKIRCGSSTGCWRRAMRWTWSAPLRWDGPPPACTSSI